MMWRVIAPVLITLCALAYVLWWARRVALSDPPMRPVDLAWWDDVSETWVDPIPSTSDYEWWDEWTSDPGASRGVLAALSADVGWCGVGWDDPLPIAVTVAGWSLGGGPVALLPMPKAWAVPE
jgi:hypothetical protein